MVSIPEQNNAIAPKLMSTMAIYQQLTQCRGRAETTERPALDSRRPANSESAFAQSKSCTVVSTVTRVAVTTPVMWAVRFPAVS